jgi:hypothetical protein
MRSRFDTADLMQISPADLLGMLRADVVSLAFGLRLATLRWLGIFSLLYGVRLLARTTTFRLYVDEPSNLIAITFFAGVLAWLFRPGLASSRELRCESARSASG